MAGSRWSSPAKYTGGYAGPIRRRSLGSVGNSEEDDSDSEPHSSTAAQAGHMALCFSALLCLVFLHWCQALTASQIDPLSSSSLSR